MMKNERKDMSDMKIERRFRQNHEKVWLPKCHQAKMQKGVEDGRKTNHKLYQLNVRDPRAAAKSAPLCLEGKHLKITSYLSPQT